MDRIVHLPSRHRSSLSLATGCAIFTSCGTVESKGRSFHIHNIFPGETHFLANNIVALAVFVLGSAVLAAQAFLYAVAPVAYPTLIRGIGVGAAVAFGRIGSIVGPLLGGRLKAAGHGPSQLLIDLLPIVVVGSMCALWLAWEVARQGVDQKADDP